MERNIFHFKLNEMFSLSQNKQKKLKKKKKTERESVCLFVCSLIWQRNSPKHLNSGSDHNYYNVLSFPFSCSSVKQQQ